MPPPRKPQRPSTTGTPPVVLVKWYDVAKWLLERVDSFPKNQRFIFGQRIASDALDILALLVEASYRRDKVALLEDANRRLEVLRWLLRMATDRKVLTGRQYQYICEQLAVCGRIRRSSIRRGVGESPVAPGAMPTRSASS